MRHKIFFVHSGNETFVRLDADLLSHFAEVNLFHAVRKFPAGFIQFWRGVRSADVVFCWFASWNSFWALLLAFVLRKPSALVIGGYDVANLPEIGYGHQRVGLQKWVSRAAMKLARVLLPFSISSQREAQRNVGVLASRMEMIYIGVPDVFGALPKSAKERMALTVGKVEWANLKRKGLEAFVRTAVGLPDVQFVLVGAWADDSIEYLRGIAPANVVFTGWVNEETLYDYYRRAAVYMQASLHEGFGLSVAEAMLAGCVPVATPAGSLPEVIGACGFYVTGASPAALTEAIQRGLTAPFSQRIQARERILTLFSLQRRAAALEKIVAGLNHAEII